MCLGYVPGRNPQLLQAAAVGFWQKAWAEWPSTATVLPAEKPLLLKSGFCKHNRRLIHNRTKHFVLFRGGESGVGETAKNHLYADAQTYIIFQELKSTRNSWQTFSPIPEQKYASTEISVQNYI